MAKSKASEALRQMVIPPRVSLEAIAARCDVTRQAVSSWLLGRMQPSPERMRILEDEFGIPMRDWTFQPEAGSEDEEGPAEPQAEAAG